MRNTLLALLCGAFLPAQAATTLYTSQAAYLAAAGPTLAYVDFAGSPGTVVAGESFTTAVQFGSCPTGLASCGTQVLHNSDAITDLGGSPAPNGVAALGGRFTALPASAFAFHHISGGVASLVFDDGSTLDTSSSSGFIGVVSSTPFNAFMAVNAVFPGGIGNDRYFFDDFRVSAVPEPASWVLLAVGALLLLELRRRDQPGMLV